MSYQGSQLDIKIGRGGLMTDLNPSDIPDSHLIIANNVEIRDGIIQKDSGSRKWNNSVLPSGIVTLLDWFPTEDLQRFIAVTREGKVYKLPDPETQTEITAFLNAPTTILVSPQIQVTAVTGGKEAPTLERKIFIYSGNSPIQVIEGDAIVRKNIEFPSVDWTVGNYPRGGIIFRDRLWAFMDHIAYASDPDDHENFATGQAENYPVGPGEGERLNAWVVYKKRLFVFKKPLGVYVLIDDNADPATWYFTKISNEFGAAGPDGQVIAVDDLLVANASGSLTSYKAVEQNAGEVEGGDVFSLMEVSNYMRNELSMEGLDERRGIYDEGKKTAYFACRSSGGIKNDRILKLDFSKSRPDITVITKDQVNCFAFRQMGKKKKIFYGNEAGWIYETDRMDRNVGGDAYTATLQTPHIDFGQADPQIANLNKIFDFVELKFVPTGRWNIDLAYYIDGIYIETIQISVSKGPVLGDFTLATDRLTANASATVRKKLYGAGRTISFKISQSGNNENFKVTGIKVYMRPSNQNQKAANSGRA